jgi:hypothetical protein
LIPMHLFLPFTWATSAFTDADPMTGLVIQLVMLPMLLFPCLMLWHNFGAVAVDENEITRYFLVGRRKIGLNQIESLNVNLFGLPGSLVVCGGKRPLRFPRTITGYSELATELQAIVERDHPPTLQLRGSPEIAFPYEIAIPPSRLTLEKVSFVLLVFIVLGIASIGLWGQVAMGQPLFTDQPAMIASAVFFVLFSLIFIPLLLVAYKVMFKSDQVVRILLTRDQIRFFFMDGSKIAFDPAQLEGVFILQVPVATRVYYDGVHVSGTTNNIDLRIQFIGEPPIDFKSSRLALFRQTPESIVEIFHILYPQ